MKNYLIFLLLLPFYSFSQSNISTEIYSRLQASKDEDKTYFQLGDYAIFTETVKNDFSPKKLIKLKKKYRVEVNEKEYKLNELGVENLVVSNTEKQSNQINTTITYYFTKKSSEEAQVIAFYSNNYKDTNVEIAFVKLFLNEVFPDSIYVTRTPENIDFIGRKINVPSNSCQFMNLRSVQCPDQGQMNWALHNSLKEAESSIKTQFTITENRKLGDVKNDTMIDVIFEGKATKARKITYKISLPKMVLGSSNVLIIYYVATEIRGHFVSCVLSHYDDEAKNTGELPALLREVMVVGK
jgi:hypothetical protein